MLDVIANNDDAKVILEGMDLKGSGINVAVNALIGSMVKNGYIDELANSILISVDNPDSQESEKLRKKLSTSLMHLSQMAIISLLLVKALLLKIKTLH